VHPFIRLAWSGWYGMRVCQSVAASFFSRVVRHCLSVWRLFRPFAWMGCRLPACLPVGPDTTNIFSFCGVCVVWMSGWRDGWTGGEAHSDRGH